MSKSFKLWLFMTVMFTLATGFAVGSYGVLLVIQVLMDRSITTVEDILYPAIISLIFAILTIAGARMLYAEHKLQSLSHNLP